MQAEDNSVQYAVCKEEAIKTKSHACPCLQWTFLLICIHSKHGRGLASFSHFTLVKGRKMKKNVWTVKGFAKKKKKQKNKLRQKGLAVFQFSLFYI